MSSSTKNMILILSMNIKKFDFIRVVLYSKGFQEFKLSNILIYYRKDMQKCVILDVGGDR